MWRKLRPQNKYKEGIKNKYTEIGNHKKSHFEHIIWLLECNVSVPLAVSSGGRSTQVKVQVKEQQMYLS